MRTGFNNHAPDRPTTPASGQAGARGDPNDEGTSANTRDTAGTSNHTRLQEPANEGHGQLEQDVSRPVISTDAARAWGERFGSSASAPTRPDTAMVTGLQRRRSVGAEERRR